MTPAMKIVSLLAAAVVLSLTACDRHEWEGEDGIKRLYTHEHESHEDHGEDHGDKAHDEHSEEGHGKDDSHSEKSTH